MDKKYFDKCSFERRFVNRAHKKELVNRGIMQGSQTDPRVANHLAQLQKCQTELIISSKISSRPTMKQLVNRHILMYQDYEQADTVRQCIANHLVTRPGPLDVIKKLVSTSSGTIDLNAPQCDVRLLSQTGNAHLQASPRPYGVSTSEENMAEPALILPRYHQSCQKESSVMSDHGVGGRSPVFATGVTGQNHPLVPGDCRRPVQPQRVAPQAPQPYYESNQTHGSKYRNIRFHKFVPNSSRAGGYFVKSGSGNQRSQDAPSSPESLHYKKLIDQQALFLQVELMLRSRMTTEEMAALESVDASDPMTDPMSSGSSCPLTEFNGDVGSVTTVSPLGSCSSFAKEQAPTCIVMDHHQHLQPGVVVSPSLNQGVDCIPLLSTASSTYEYSTLPLCSNTYSPPVSASGSGCAPQFSKSSLNTQLAGLGNLLSDRCGDVLQLLEPEYQGCQFDTSSWASCWTPRLGEDDNSRSDIVSSGYHTGVPSSDNSHFELPFFGFGISNDCDGCPSIVEKVELFEKLASYGAMNKGTRNF